jgi:glutathione synthase
LALTGAQGALMKICFVVRSVAGQAPTYTTTHLAFEAFRRGHLVAFASIQGFNYSDTQGVRATVVIPRDRQVNTPRDFLEALNHPYAIRTEMGLEDFDVVFLRYNPAQSGVERSHNPAIEFGRLLKQKRVLVVNDPAGLERASSKMYLMSLPASVRAKTLVSRSPQRIKEFIRELRRPVIIKPLNGYGGQDVFLVKNAKDINLNQIISAVAKSGYVMAQEYLTEIKKGDKRLLLLNGEPIFIGNQPAIYKRMAPPDDIRANIHVGGTRRPAELTDKERLIVEKIRSRIVADGLYFVGADLIGEKLIELNVFCPGGIHNINELYGINVGEYVIADLERRSRVWRTHAFQQQTPVSTRPAYA